MCLPTTRESVSLSFFICILVLTDVMKTKIIFEIKWSTDFPGRIYDDIELPGKSADNFITTSVERKTAATEGLLPEVILIRSGNISSYIFQELKKYSESGLL